MSLKLIIQSALAHCCYFYSSFKFRYSVYSDVQVILVQKNKSVECNNKENLMER